MSLGVVLPDLKLVANKMAEGGNFKVDGSLQLGSYRSTVHVVY